MSEPATDNSMDLTLTFTLKQTRAWRALSMPQTDEEWLACNDQTAPIEVHMGGGKGSGKSVWVCAAAYLYALEVIRFFDLPRCRDVPHIGWIGRKIAQVFVGTTMETWKELIPSACYKLVGASEQHPRHILIDNRVAIDYGGLDTREDLNRFNSAQYGFVALDQADEAEEDDVRILRATRRMKLYCKRLKQKVCLPYRGLWTSNPPVGHRAQRHTWLRKMFMESADPHKVFVASGPKDNPHLPSGYMATLLDAFCGRPDLVKAYIEGDYAAAAGADQIILPEWVTAAKVRRRRIPYVKRWVSIDPAAYGDNLTVLLGGENTEIIDARVFPKCGEPQIVVEAEAMTRRLGDEPALGRRVTIIVETVGVCGIADFLIQDGFVAIAYCPAGKEAEGPAGTQYANPRSRLWCTVGRWMYDGFYDTRVDSAFSLPEPQGAGVKAAWEQVCEQLVWAWFEFRGQRILVAAKEDIKAEHGGISPDYGDCYVNGVGHLPEIPAWYSTEPGYRSAVERRRSWVDRERIPVLNRMGFVFL